MCAVCLFEVVATTQKQSWGDILRKEIKNIIALSAFPLYLYGHIDADPFSLPFCICAQSPIESSRWNHFSTISCQDHKELKMGELVNELTVVTKCSLHVRFAFCGCFWSVFALPWSRGSQESSGRLSLFGRDANAICPFFVFSRKVLFLQGERRLEQTYR